MHNKLIPGTNRDMIDKGYWIDRIDDKDSIIMDSKEIDAFNKNILGCVDTICDLENYSEIISKDEIIKLIEKYRVPDEDRYDINGNKVSGYFYRKVSDNRNIGSLSEKITVKYGIAVKNISVRSFPTKEGIYETENDKEFDLFQETLCQALEPVVVLHESRDREWYFIQKYNYAGWVKKSGIALGSREEIFNYINSKNYLMVTGNHVFTRPNPFEERVSRQEFDMGCRIPLERDDTICQVGNQSSFANYIVSLPVRDNDGTLSFRDGLISINDDVTIGCLKYTRENIINQVFKLLGDRYGWGDSFRGRDCSSTLMYVYKTFGIMLPRNGNDQEKVPGKKISFTPHTSKYERIEILRKVKPGAGLYMPGHVMMYLGEDNGSYYMIHNFHKYGSMENGELKTYCVNEAAVTNCLLLTSSGVPFMERFTSAIMFE